MKQHYEYLIAGLILGFSLSLLFIAFFTLNLDLIKILAFIIPFGAFLFAITKYVEELQYKKKKDTYEFYEKMIFEKFLDLTNEIGERFKYREYFLSLSTDEVIAHKQDLKKVEFILNILLSKINNNVIDEKIIKSVFNENSKEMFLNLLVHHDLTLLSHPIAIYELYEFLHDDIIEFREKTDRQFKEIQSFMNTSGKSLMKVTVDDSEKSVEAWLEITANKVANCADKEEVLKILQTIKGIYPLHEIYSNIGAVYAKCFADHIIALKYFQKSYSLNKANIYAYAGAMLSNFRINKNIDLAFRELESMDSTMLEDDFILQNKIGLLLESGDKNSVIILLEQIKDPMLKQAIIRKLI